MRWSATAQAEIEAVGLTASAHRVPQPNIAASPGVRRQAHTLDLGVRQHSFGMTREIVFSLRTLRRSPLFTGAAILSLALGIGANTAIFSLLTQVVLRSLPVEDPE